MIYTRLATGHRWHFDSSDGPVQVDVSGRFRADNSEAVREAVIGGAGIAVLPVWLFTDEIDRGLVRVILEQFEPTRLADPCGLSVAPPACREGARDDRLPRRGVRAGPAVVDLVAPRNMSECLTVPIWPVRRFRRWPLQFDSAASVQR